MKGTNGDLCDLAGADALALFQARKLSPVELMTAVIARAEAVEPAVNAFCDRYFEEALAKARRAEARYASRSARPRSLEGLPLAVKDDTAMKGRRSTGGSLIDADLIDRETAPAVARLERAGAIVHARSTCPEFCWTWTCTSRIHGVTRNPWNLAMTPGGSSGGSAAALAAGSTTLAVGTDSAGSIRQPAALCNLVGFKPPYGRNPQSPGSAFDSYNHIGPMTRTLGDAVLMQNVMAGPHPADHATVRPKLRLPTRPKSIKGLKIAYSLDLDCRAIDPEVRRETLAALQALAGAGAILEEVATPWAAAAIEASGHHGDLIYADAMTKAVRDHPDLVCDYTRYFEQQNRQVRPADFRGAMTLAGQIWAEHLGPLFQRHDLFACPTVGQPAIPAEQKPWDATLACNGRLLADHECTLTQVFNMFSRCPVLALPSGFTDNGLPTSLQVVGRPFDDRTVFACGVALEQQRPWSCRRPEL